MFQADSQWLDVPVKWNAHAKLVLPHLGIGSHGFIARTWLHLLGLDCSRKGTAFREQRTHHDAVVAWWQMRRMNFSPASARVSRTLACALLALFGSSACAAVFPEVKTPLKTLDEGSELAPPPPDDLLYLYVQSADIPEKTRDGRGWDAVGGEAPDPVSQERLRAVRGS